MKSQVLILNNEVRVTEKDIETIQLLANDHKTTEAAQILEISHRTIENRIYNMKAKYGKRTIAGLVYLFYQNKLIK